MSYCIHCGKPSDDGLRFCPYCGEPKDGGDAIPSEPVVNQPIDEPMRHRGSTALIVIWALVGAVAAGTLVLAFVGPAMGIQFPWVEQEEQGVVAAPDESTGTEVGGNAGTGVETTDKPTASNPDEVEVVESPQVPTAPQNVTGVATGDSSWPYGDSLMMQSYKIRSSSVLDPQAGNTYEPTNVADNNVSTCWAEGVAGLGEGEWLSFENVTGSTQSISGLEIVNGYGKEGRFETNTTPTSADLYLIDGPGNAEKVAQLALMASDAPQLLEFSPPIELGPNEILRLTITGSRLMSDGADPDACISEVKILD